MTILFCVRTGTEQGAGGGGVVQVSWFSENLSFESVAFKAGGGKVKVEQLSGSKKILIRWKLASSVINAPVGFADDVRHGKAIEFKLKLSGCADPIPVIGNGEVPLYAV